MKYLFKKVNEENYVLLKYAHAWLIVLQEKEKKQYANYLRSKLHQKFKRINKKGSWFNGFRYYHKLQECNI